MIKADNNKIPNLEDIADLDLAAVAAGRFKEEDIDSINVIRGEFIERYPDKTGTIDLILSLLENDTREFSYTEVVNIVAAAVTH